MSWLNNFVRPKIRALVSRSEVPDNLWTKCPGCSAMLFHRELDANLGVCFQCGQHFRMRAERRLDLLLEQPYDRLELPRVAQDPLKFRDLKRYSDRLREAQTKSNAPDAMLAAAGTLAGLPLVVAAFEFDFMGGSMGTAVGEALLTAARVAVERKAALVVVPASGGARMQEGILSLMQMPRSTIAVQLVREAGLPYIVVLTDPTTGGVSASFAMLGDIAIAEPGATIGFAGLRVIEETIREKLPEGFQRSEYLLEHGLVDLVVPRAELRAALARVLGLLMRPGSLPPPAAPLADAVPIAEAGAGEAERRGTYAGE